MKLTSKLTIAISAGFVFVVGGLATLWSQQELHYNDDELSRHGQLLGHVVASSVEDTWRRSGEAEARELVEEIDRHEPKTLVRIVDLDAPPLPDEGATFHTFVPLNDTPGHLAIDVAEPEPSHGALERLQWTLAIAAILACGVATLLAHLLGRYLVGRRVASMVNKLRRIAERKPSPPAIERGNDELSYLAREINRTEADLDAALDLAARRDAERRDAEDQLRHAERLATLGRLASGVAHEIGTPLQSIVMRAELIESQPDQGDAVVANAVAIKRQVERVVTIVKSLLRFARRQKPSRSLQDLREVVANATSLVRTVKSPQPVEIVERCVDDHPLARVDREQLEQVLTNLVLNGVQAMPEGGRITVGVSREHPTPQQSEEREPTPGDYLCLSVEDEGTGVSDEIKEHMFEPFFTTKGVGEGTGLGLSIAYGIVKDHGGWIEVESEPGRGSRFSVFLPAAEPG